MHFTSFHCTILNPLSCLATHKTARYLSPPLHPSSSIPLIPPLHLLFAPLSTLPSFPPPVLLLLSLSPFLHPHSQVLSDEKLRYNYDHGGKDGVEGAPKMDSGALYAMIFGSEKFEPLVGTYSATLDAVLQNRINVGECKRIRGGNGDFNSAHIRFHSVFRKLYSVPATLYNLDGQSHTSLSSRNPSLSLTHSPLLTNLISAVPLTVLLLISIPAWLHHSPPNVLNSHLFAGELQLASNMQAEQETDKNMTHPRMKVSERACWRGFRCAVCRHHSAQRSKWIICNHFSSFSACFKFRKIPLFMYLVPKSEKWHLEVAHTRWHIDSVVNDVAHLHPSVKMRRCNVTLNAMAALNT